MAQFKLSATVTISIYTTVEADTLEEAIAQAERRNIEFSNNNNSDEQEESVWIADELDGMPERIKLAEI